MRFAIGAFALLALSSGVSAQCDGSCQCEVDSCFRDLAGPLPFPPQPAISDCRDFLWVHSTWGSETSTITSWVTNGVVTEVISETEISTVSEGTTTVETITNTVTETETTTSGAGSFTGAPITTVVAPLRRRRRKRQANIPAYASACGGSIGYSSACTCIGVSADGTTWTEVPTVTTTITSTVASTETVSETETVLTTVVGDFAGATETSTLEKTATEQVIQPQYTSFVLQLTNDDANGAGKGYFLRWAADPGNSNRRRLMVTANVEDATLYKADGSGVVSTQVGGYGFARDATSTGPGLWQESASGKVGWLDYVCNINADRLFSCNDAGRAFMSFDPSDGSKMRVWTYIHNIFSMGNVGPLVIAAVPQDTTTIAPAAAISVRVRARSTGNGIYNGQYIGIADQDSQPFQRVRFYDSTANAVTFKADPTRGNLLGPNNAPFSAQVPTAAQPMPFLLGGYDNTRVIHHVLADFSTLGVTVDYPSQVRHLGAVIVNPGDTGVPFFRVHLNTNMLADEQGPLTLEIEIL
ncbi:hypothetical protein TWF718_005425 [Orbilia javanica]|uniref:Uncharacterized protein n=1 Tax=Orbilia javanica TaxID=47235 RepID=A0AAN8MYX4_9PEZI